MVLPGDDAASVRIELADDSDTIEVPPPPDGRSGRGQAGLLALLVALALVAVLVFANRPDDGTSAAGTPITVPTSAAPEESAAIEGSATTATTQSGLVDEPAPSTDEPIGDGFERAPLEAFFTNILPVELGWIAMAINDADNVAELWRSVDGVNWERLPSDTQPPGDLLGFDRVDGNYLLAVDEAESWSQPGFVDFEAGFPDHRITVWSSDDAVNWDPTDLPALEGTGFPYPVSFGRDGYVVPMLRTSDTPNQALIDLLAPFVDAETAADVCRFGPDDSAGLVLVACDGAVLAELSSEDNPNIFQELPEYCIVRARQADVEASVVFVDRSGEEVRQRFTNFSWLFGRAIESGFLASGSTEADVVLPPECGDADVDAGADVLFVERSTVTDVSPSSSDVTNDGFGGVFGQVGKGPDGRGYVAFAGSVWAGEAPFDQWDEVLSPPLDMNGAQHEGMALTITPDGQHALWASSDALFVATVGGEWIELEARTIVPPSTAIVVAADDYVVISNFGTRGQELIKVPIPQ